MKTSEGNGQVFTIFYIRPPIHNHTSETSGSCNQQDEGLDTFSDPCDSLNCSKNELCAINKAISTV